MRAVRGRLTALLTALSALLVGSALPGAAPATAAGPAEIEAFITQVYDHLLQRAPDPAGLQGWSEALQQGTPYGAVALGITSSDEYRSILVTETYQTYLGREPEPIGAAAWLAAMRAGVTVQTIEGGFIASDEYYARAGGTDASWVRELYRDVLAREAVDHEVATWTDTLVAGATRTQVAAGLLLSTEHLLEVVDRYYRLLLDRSADPDGLHAWVVAIQSGTRVEAVIAGIVASEEYRAAP